MSRDAPSSSAIDKPPPDRRRFQMTVGTMMRIILVIAGFMGLLVLAVRGLQEPVAQARHLYK